METPDTDTDTETAAVRRGFKRFIALSRPSELYRSVSGSSQRLNFGSNFGGSLTSSQGSKVKGGKENDLIKDMRVKKKEPKGRVKEAIAKFEQKMGVRESTPPPYTPVRGGSGFLFVLIRQRVDCSSAWADCQPTNPDRFSQSHRREPTSQ